MPDQSPPTEDAPRPPRILLVTPEITYLPEGMGNLSQTMCAKAGGLADVSSLLANELHKLGAEVHLALPNFRRLGSTEIPRTNSRGKALEELQHRRIHFAEDNAFYHRDQVYEPGDNTRMALAFQRELATHIIPAVQPDLIHCNDWMTGLVPALARARGIKSLFTVHNIHTERFTLDEIEDRGIDGSEFWQHLYFEKPPGSHDEARSWNRVDQLTSGIFASDHVNTVSPTFLSEVVDGLHDFIPDPIRNELRAKDHAGCASGILNAPDANYAPATDDALAQNYTTQDHVEGKRANKLAFQERLGLRQDPDAPIFFWPSRLDPIQKGPHLLAEILHQIVADYSADNLQVAIVANGAYQHHFHDIINIHGFRDRVAVADFSEPLSRLGYAGADFMLMPSSFEPCGLPQMVSPKYGTLPVVHDTGGIHDTIFPLDTTLNTGNGFPFQVFDAGGLRWAIDQAMAFHRLPPETRAIHIKRVMLSAEARFRHDATAASYVELYKSILGVDLKTGEPLS